MPGGQVHSSHQKTMETTLNKAKDGRWGRPGMLPLACLPSAAVWHAFHGLRRSLTAYDYFAHLKIKAQHGP